METIQHQYETTLTILQDLWGQIGLNEDEQQQETHTLHANVMEAFQKHIASTREQVDELNAAVLDNDQQLQTIASRLGQKITPESQNFATLLQQCEASQQQLQEWEGKRDERMEELQFALDELSAVWDELEWPADKREGLTELGDDLSDNFHTLVQKEVSKAYEERSTRQRTVKALYLQITALWAELQQEPESAFEKTIAHERTEIGVTATTMASLQDTLSALSKVKQEREEQVRDYAVAITKLWDLLQVDEDHREHFFSHHTGLGKAVLDACQKELDSMTELKDLKMRELVEQARGQLVELWDAMHLSQPERDAFAAFSVTDGYDEALLQTHQAEIEATREKLMAMQPLLKLIHRREDIRSQAKEMKRKAADPQRLLSKKSDAGRLLREEKIRAMIRKDLPRIEAKLEKECAAWAEEYGSPFVYAGVPFIDFMQAQKKAEEEEAEAEKRRKEEEKKARLADEMMMGTTASSSSSARTPGKALKTPGRRTVGRTPRSSVKKPRAGAVSSIRSAPSDTLRSPLVERSGAGGARSLNSAHKRARTPLSKATFVSMQQDEENQVENTPGNNAGRSTRSSTKAALKKSKLSFDEQQVTEDVSFVEEDLELSFA